MAWRTEPDDLVWRQFHAAEMHCCLTLVGSEQNRGSVHPRRNVQDPRQAFVAAVYVHSGEIDARQLGAVFAASGDDPLYL